MYSTAVVSAPARRFSLQPDWQRLVPVRIKEEKKKFNFFLIFMLNVLRQMMLWSICALFSIRRQCAKIKPTVALFSLRFCSIFNVSGTHKEQIQQVFSLNKMKKNSLVRFYS